MTTLEFTDQFDILYNNITSNQAPGLDVYEKSVLLTLALDDILKAYFNPKGNKFVEGYGDNIKRDVDFSMLIDTRKYTGESFGEPVFVYKDNAVSIVFPRNVLFVLNEFAIVRKVQEELSLSNTNRTLQVIPLNYLEYTRLQAKPYKRPLKNQAWRISNLNVNINSLLERQRRADIIAGTEDKIIEYRIRYIMLPPPIILESLKGTPLSIRQEQLEQTCILDEELHPEILKRAVELAKSSYMGDLSSSIILGLNSSTNMGIVSSNTSNNRD